MQDFGQGRPTSVRCREQRIRPPAHYLRQAGMDVDDEMARLAIRIYTERNEVSHAEVGNLNITRDLQALSTQASALGATVPVETTLSLSFNPLRTPITKTWG